MHGLTNRNLNSLSPEGIPIKELWTLPVSHLARSKILEALQKEPFLTTAQVAKLFYSIKRDGTPAKATEIRVRNRAYPVTPGHWAARDMLDRMASDKLIVKVPPPKGFDKTTLWWTLPGTKLPSKYGIQHEMDAAELFVAYKRTGKLEHWDAKWSPQEWEVVQGFNIKYDRRMELSDNNQVFFWEVDRGTEIRDTLVNKVDKYIKLSSFVPSEPMTVVFTVENSRWANADERIKYLVKYFSEVHRGNQFLAVKHQTVVNDPLGAVFHNYRNELITLDSLNWNPKRTP